MISSLMAGVYWTISKVMLFWHMVFDAVSPQAAVLGTNWQWILAIVFLVITVRVVLFPIFVKQIKSQRAMQVLAPKIKELQVKHKGDRETLQKETMALYQSEKVNPLMGCLPMFLQIPVFIGLLHVLRWLSPITPEDKRTLYGWSTSLFNSAIHAHLFGAPIAAKFSSNAQEIAGMQASGTAVKIVAAVLVLIMMSTTFLTQRQMIQKTGWNQDPQQRMIQKFMLYGVPFFTLTSGWYFPIGVIIYWVTNNIITMAQQFWVLHKYPPPSVAGKPAAVTGTAKSAPAKSGPPAKSTPPPKPALAKKAAAAKSTPPAKSGTPAKNSAPAKNSTPPKSPVQPARGGLLGRLASRNGAGKVDSSTGSANGKDGSSGPVVDGKSLAPRPGAKPVNPKKGGPAKRQSG